MTVAREKTATLRCTWGQAGFSLIELLAVIAVVGLLAGLLLAAVQSAKRQSSKVQCLSNMRQMGIAVQLFTGDHAGALPGTSHGISWTNTLAAYLGPNFIGKCPAVPQHRARVTYGWNDCLATNGFGLKENMVRTPSLTMAMAELAIDQSSEHFHFSGVRGGPARVTPNQFKDAVNVEVHGVGANYVFVDGHAEIISWADIQARLTQPNPTLIVP